MINTNLAAKCKEEDLIRGDLNNSKIVVSRVFPPRCVNNVQLTADCVAKKKKKRSEEAAFSCCTADRLTRKLVFTRGRWQESENKNTHTDGLTHQVWPWGRIKRAVVSFPATHDFCHVQTDLLVVCFPVFHNNHKCRAYILVVFIINCSIKNTSQC